MLKFKQRGPRNKNHAPRIGKTTTFRSKDHFLLLIDCNVQIFCAVLYAATNSEGGADFFPGEPKCSPLHFSAWSWKKSLSEKAFEFNINTACTWFIYASHSMIKFHSAGKRTSWSYNIHRVNASKFFFALLCMNLFILYTLHMVY